MRIAAVIFSTIIGVSFLNGSALAQQKTVKACQEEWRANRADNQAKGITQKTYVEQCRAGTIAAQPVAPSPTERKAATPPPRSAPAPTVGAAPARPAAPPSTTATPMGANQYAAETQAKMRCGTGTVVWANLDSKIYH